MELLKHKYSQLKQILLTPLCWQFWSGMADHSQRSGRMLFPPFSLCHGGESWAYRQEEELQQYVGRQQPCQEAGALLQA